MKTRLGTVRFVLVLDLLLTYWVMTGKWAEWESSDKWSLRPYRYKVVWFYVHALEIAKKIDNLLSWFYSLKISRLFIHINQLNKPLLRASCVQIIMLGMQIYMASSHKQFKLLIKPGVVAFVCILMKLRLEDHLRLLSIGRPHVQEKKTN
jgi:hypothetical protein